MEEKLLEDHFKQAEEKQGRFIGLVEDVYAKSSSMISFWKDLELQYGTIRESLRQRGHQLDLQAKETEEAWKKVEEQKTQVQVQMEAALGFLDKAREKEREMGLLDSELGLKKEELQGKEKTLEVVQQRVEEWENLLGAKETEMKVLERAFENLCKEVRWKEGERDSVELKREEMTSELLAKERELAEVNSEISKCNAESESQEKLLGHWKKNLEFHYEQVSLRTEQWTSLLNSIEESSEKLEFNRKELERVGNLISSCSCELREKEERLSEVENVIRECNAEEETSKKRLCAVVMELEEKQQLLEAKCGEISAKEKELSSLEKEVQKRVDLISDLKSELQEKGNDLDELKRLIVVSNTEHDLKEKESSLLQEKTRLCSEELCCTKTSIEDCLKELDLKKRELDETRTLVEKQQEEISLNKVHLTTVVEKIKECAEELESKETKLNFVGRNLEASVKHLESKETELSTIETKIKAKDKVLKVKGNLHRLVESKMNGCRKELDLMKEQTISLKTLVEEFTLALESSSKSVENAGEEMKQCCGKIESKVVGLSSIETKLLELQNNLAETRKHMEERAKVVEMERMELQKEVDMIKVREVELVSKEKLIQERVTELEAREKQLSIDEQRNKKQQLETAENIVAEDHHDFTSVLPSTCTLTCHSSPDSLLVDEPSQPNLTDVEVREALKVSPDPAGMIFGLLKDSVSRPADETVSRSWVLILEQLVGFSAEVSPEVKAAAIEVAVTWRRKLGQQAQSSMNVLAFLLFVAAYGATSHFEAEDMIELVVMIADHESAVKLCGSLGLVEWIPELIWRLCKKNKHIEAVRFSVAFNLVNEFEPNKLLWDHLSKARIFEDGHDLLQSQYEALNNHLDKLKALPQKVVRLGVDPSFVIEKISDHLGHLETIMGRKRSSLLGARVIMKIPMHGDYATVTGNNGRVTVWGNNLPCQSIYLAGENQGNKRQKRG